jgi:hypothetical protein
MGLPSGSIRAILAIAIFATTWALLVLRPTLDIPDYLRDLLFIIMGHYFAARHRAATGPPAGPPPLYLPNGSVRALLVVGCAAVAVVLFRRGQLTDLTTNPGVVTLLMVGGFLGVVFNAIYSWWKERGLQPSRIVEDLRAWISVIAAGLLVALVVNRYFPFIPKEQLTALAAARPKLGPYGPEHLLSAVVGFYFGSRS